MEGQDLDARQQRRRQREPRRALDLAPPADDSTRRATQEHTGTQSRTDQLGHERIARLVVLGDEDDRQIRRCAAQARMDMGRGLGDRILDLRRGRNGGRPLHAA